MKIVYIRVKRVKKFEYAYLVKNVWIEKKPKQIILKYLGNISELTIGDIPKQYRTSNSIKSFFEKPRYNIKEVSELETNLQDKLFRTLLDFNMNEILNIYSYYTKTFSVIRFYENILIPILQRIGDMWATGTLDIVTEHVCSNATSNLISIINKKFYNSNMKNKKNKKIIVCTPIGELHTIACAIIESSLLEKGYSNVSNIAPSVPNESIIRYIIDTNPSLVIISITLQEHKNTVKRLVNEICKNHTTNIVVAGAGSIALKENDATNYQDKKNRIAILPKESISDFIKKINIYT